MTQIKTRTFCDVICVNLRDLRENGWVGDTINRSTDSGYLEEAAYLGGIEEDLAVLHFDRQGLEV